MRILTLTKETQQNILENLLKRSPNSYGEYEGRVNAIIEEVRANRDAAVFSYTKKFDGADSARIPGLIHRNPALS